MDGDFSTVRELVEGLRARIDDFDNRDDDISAICAVDDVHGEARREVSGSDENGADCAESLRYAQLVLVWPIVARYKDLTVSVVVEMPRERAVEPIDLNPREKPNGDCARQGDTMKDKSERGWSATSHS